MHGGLFRHRQPKGPVSATALAYTSPRHSSTLPRWGRASGLAQRLDCAQLAAAVAAGTPIAFETPTPFESAGKPDAVQTLRAVGTPGTPRAASGLPQGRRVFPPTPGTTC